MAIRQKTNVTSKVSGHPPSHARTGVAVCHLNVVIDEPVERGGPNLGAARTELANIALMGGTMSIGNKCAEALGADLGKLDCDLEIDHDRRGVLLME